MGHHPRGLTSRSAARAGLDAFIVAQAVATFFAQLARRGLARRRELVLQHGRHRGRARLRARPPGHLHQVYYARGDGSPPGAVGLVRGATWVDGWWAYKATIDGDSGSLCGSQAEGDLLLAGGGLPAFGEPW